MQEANESHAKDFLALEKVEEQVKTTEGSSSTLTEYQQAQALSAISDAKKSVQVVQTVQESLQSYTLEHEVQELSEPFFEYDNIDLYSMTYKRIILLLNRLKTIKLHVETLTNNISEHETEFKAFMNDKSDKSNTIYRDEAESFMLVHNMSEW